MLRNSASRSRLQKWLPEEAMNAKDCRPALSSSIAARAPGPFGEGLTYDAHAGSVRGSRPRNTVGMRAKSAGSKNSDFSPEHSTRQPIGFQRSMSSRTRGRPCAGSTTCMRQPRVRAKRNAPSCSLRQACRLEVWNRSTVSMTAKVYHKIV